MGELSGHMIHLGHRLQDPVSPAGLVDVSAMAWVYPRMARFVGLKWFHEWSILGEPTAQVLRQWAEDRMERYKQSSLQDAWQQLLGGDGSSSFYDLAPGRTFINHHEPRNHS